MSDDADADGPAIRRLDERTVERIAAGEVVERPASVVKELVENALDAGASRIAVAVEGDGTDSIRVRDDGAGMTAADLDLAVAEHATSKIDDADDLDRVGTLGFRGEALHTIAAVSRTTIRSRPPDADRGHELAVEGGQAGDVHPVGCPPGTVVEVEDLFYNTPARRKFLKTAATEFDHVNAVVAQYALANPDVAVSLDHDDRETFATDGRGDRRAAVLSVYGREVAESMVDVAWTADDGPVTAVEGLVSHPETTRSGRDYLSTFVNGRYVPAAALRTAVVDAYGGQLASDRYPFAVLFLDVSPDAVDVNVHPRKTEVRFDDEPAVARVVERAVREALLDHGLVRSTAPRGRGAPDEAAVDPEPTDGDEAVGGAGTAHERASGVGGPRRERPPTPVDAAGESGDGEETGVPATADDAETAAAATGGEHDAPGTSAADAPGNDPDATAGAAADAPGATGRAPSPRRFQDDEPAGPDAPDGPDDAGAADPTDPTDAAGTGRPAGVTGQTDQRTLTGEAAGRHEFERLPRMRVLGQLHDTYVVAETPEGLVLIDQHAADERVNYERLRADLAGETPTQALAEPIELELTAREAALFAEHDEALASLGFHAGRTGERTVAVRAVPAVFDAALDPAVLRDALLALAADEEGGERTVEAVADDLLADLACHPSITGNTSLTAGSVVDLLAALDDCENPYACPHGRPTVVALDRDELSERFERDYPGHGRRRDDA